MNQDKSVAFYNQYPYPNLPGGENLDLRYWERILEPRDRYKSILIVGCGTGEEVLKIHKILSKPQKLVTSHKRLTAIEPSKKSLIIAKKKVGDAICDFYCKSIEDFNPVRKYDLILCSGVLHHTIDPEKNLLRLVSWLSERGEIVLGIYHHARWEIKPPLSGLPQIIADIRDNPQEKTYSWRGVTELVNGANLTIIKNGHRIPTPRNRFTQVLTDMAFLYRKQQMILLRCIK